jgi:hypothetical protein
VGADGRRCSARRLLEFHHVRPFAVGGEATESDIRLACRRHNGLEARLFFARDEGGGAGTVGEASLPYACSVWNESDRVACTAFGPFA